MSQPNPNHKNLRQGRHDEAGLFYFLTATTKYRQNFFSNPSTTQIVLDALKWQNQRERITLVAAVIMPDHIHFVAQPKDITLSKLMHSLKSYTANEINRVLGRKGGMFGKDNIMNGA